MQKPLKIFKRIIQAIKNHKKRALLVFIPLAILAITFWPRPQKTIEIQVVKRTNIVESISTTGTVDATSVDLTFLTGGKLVYLGAKKGDSVTAGQTIAVLDQRTVQKNLENALRDYAKQRNTFDSTKEDNQNRTPEQALNDDMKRILQNNQYDLEKAVISVELQDLAKQQAVVTTPISGIVTKADVQHAGVNVSATTKFTVSDLSDTKFNIDIDEADIGRVVVGQSVKVTLDSYPDQTLDLFVKSIDYAAHTTTTGGNVYTVEVTMPTNSALQYRIGMNGDAEIITDEKSDVLIVPLSSIADDNFIYVKKGSMFEKRKVEVGISNDTDAEIRSGVEEGDEVALDPTETEKVAKK